VTSSDALRLASTGIAIVGVCYGMARYGYGLLLPDIGRDFSLGPDALGAIATGGYAAYLAATALTGAFAARVGARGMATAAALLAAAGMVIAGVSPSPAILAAGMLVAGASAGLAFPPFSDAVRGLVGATRGRVLSAIACGTGYGVALAAPIALLVGSAWRTAMLVFAGIALLAAARAWRNLPAQSITTPRVSPRGLVCRRALPLLAAGLLVGIGSAAFWTFAVAHLQDAGALSTGTSRAFLGLVGLSSVLGTLAGDLVERAGSARAYLTVITAEALAIGLLALKPSSIAAAVCSAVVFGATFNLVTAVQVLWSTHLYAEQPSLGASAVLAATGIGLMLGPLGAGLLVSPLGLGPVLLLGAALVASAAALAPREDILNTVAAHPASPRAPAG
jgi:predicted MFS family arabinose efflux permease